MRHTGPAVAISRPEAVAAVAPGYTPRWGLLEWFIIAQTALPALLFLPGTQEFRLLIRVAAFAVSLWALAAWAIGPRRTVPRHPAEPWLTAAVCYLILMIFHPTTNNLIAGVAQVTLYVAVLAPIVWVAPTIGGAVHARRLLLLLLFCSGINSLVGVLQVYDPGRWMPAEFSHRVLQSTFGLEMVSYIGPDGQRIVRPPGLFDTPGAVAGPGMFAALLGLAFSVAPAAYWKRVLALVLACAGLAAIYLSHVRTSLLLVMAMAAVYAVLLAVRKERSKALFLGTATAAIFVVAFIVSVSLGGAAIRDRFTTLVDNDLLDVYYTSGRGHHLEYAFRTLVMDYPLGAGLGRWGMTHAYFGDPSNLDAAAIWAELQPNAWIIDGGLVLLGLYGFALLVTFRHELKILRCSEGTGLARWAAVILALNTGTIVLVFGFTPFTTAVGLQYWLLAGILHGAAYRERVLR